MKELEKEVSGDADQSKEGCYKEEPAVTQSPPGPSFRFLWSSSTTYLDVDESWSE